MKDSDRSLLQEMLNRLWREIYTRWFEDEDILDHLRRQLEDLLIGVKNQLARIEMSKIEK